MASATIRESVESWLLGGPGPSRQDMFAIARGWASDAKSGLSDWELDEEAEEAENAVRDVLAVMAQDAIELETPVLFSLDHDQVDLARFVYRHDDPSSDTDLSRSQSLRVREMHSVCEAMLRLDARSALSFELFCADVLKRRGLQIDVPSQRTKDGGVDFYGYSPGLKGVGLGAQAAFRIMGQAKKQAGPITEEQADHFVVQTERLRRCEGRACGLLPEEFVQSPLPLKGVFCTAGRFTRGAHAALSHASIAQWNGVQLGWNVILSADEWFLETGTFLVNEFVSFFNDSAKHFALKWHD